MLHQLLRLGVTDRLKIEEAQVVRLTNILALLPVPIYAFYIGYGFYFGYGFSAGLASSMIALTAACVWANARGSYGLAKFLLFWLNGFSAWLTWQVFNVDYSVLTTYFPILFGYAFFFNIQKEKPYFYASLGFTIAFIVSALFLPRFWIHSIQLEGDTLALSNLFHILFSFVITAIVVMVIYRNHQLTDKKLIEAREEAERYSKLQTDFLANMSHEIRTPLVGVVGMSELLHETQLTDEQREYANTIALSSHMLLGVVNNVLDLSKLEANRIKLEPVDFDLRKSVHGIANMLKPSLQKKPVKLLIDCDRTLPHMLHGDEKRIEQVLSNLVSNAVKFTEQGRVVVRVKVIKQFDEMVWVEMEVSDTGIGIPADQQSKLFTRFYQVDTSLHRRHMGTGLGLVICKTMTELMGGEIEFTSTHGEGSTFRVKLPLKRTADFLAPDEATPPVNNEPKGLKILVAEDNRINQMVISKLLNNRGYAVDLAENGNEAYEKAVQADYDLILMDVQMPGKDGIETTRELRARLKGKTRPIIIALTANALREDKEKCLEAGMNDYLTKPVTRADIDNMIGLWF